MTLPILFATLTLGSAAPTLPGDFDAPHAIVNLDDVSGFIDLSVYGALGEKIDCAMC